FFPFISPCPPRSTLFPYTTLFRSALTELEVGGHFFGECSLTLVLLGHDGRAQDRAAAEALKMLAAHDGSFHLETYNLLNAWTAKDRKSTRLNSSHLGISYAVFCLK